MARNTSSEAVYEANADWLEATGGLRLADLLSVHDAIHDPTKRQVTLSTGLTLPVTVSANGCRRVDMVVDPDARPKGRCKLMAQNLTTGSKAAKRACEGAEISHVIPLDAQGRHTAAQYSHDWGMVEEGKLVKHCRAVLNVQDVASATGKRVEPPPKRRKLDAAPRRFLNCPIAEKGAVKALGAKWDAAERKWFVPDGLAMAPFARWDPTAPSVADGSTPVDPAFAAGRAMREAAADEYFDPSSTGGFGIEDMSAEGTEERHALQTAFAGYERWLQKGASDQDAVDYFNGQLALAADERKRETQPQVGSRQAPVLVD